MIEELRDYCRGCVTECGCGRLDTFTEPDEIAVVVSGPRVRMVATYHCEDGHRWTTGWSSELEPLHAGREG